MTLSEDLAQKLRMQGADLVGYADLSNCSNGELKSGISIVIALPKEVVRGISDGPTQQYYDAYIELNERLDQLSEFAANYLKRQGYQAVGQTTTTAKEDHDYCTVMPHKTVATAAGIGWIGKNALLVTKEFGSAVRLTSVLTDAPLSFGVPIHSSVCGSCMNCTNACPAKAIHGVNWSVLIQRKELVDIYSCRKVAREIAKEKINKEITLCGKCFEVCPYTRRYLNKKEEMNVSNG